MTRTEKFTPSIGSLTTLLRDTNPECRELRCHVLRKLNDYTPVFHSSSYAQALGDCLLDQGTAKDALLFFARATSGQQGEPGVVRALLDARPAFVDAIRLVARIGESLDDEEFSRELLTARDLWKWYRKDRDPELDFLDTQRRTAITLELAFGPSDGERESFKEFDGADIAAIARKIRGAPSATDFLHSMLTSRCRVACVSTGTASDEPLIHLGPLLANLASERILTHVALPFRSDDSAALAKFIDHPFDPKRCPVSLAGEYPEDIDEADSRALYGFLNSIRDLVRVHFLDLTSRNDRPISELEMGSRVHQLAAILGESPDNRIVVIDYPFRLVKNVNPEACLSLPVALEAGIPSARVQTALSLVSERLLKRPNPLGRALELSNEIVSRVIRTDDNPVGSLVWSSWNDDTYAESWDHVIIWNSRDDDPSGERSQRPRSTSGAPAPADKVLV